MVKALAGTGKTTTALQVIKEIPRGRSILVMPFNTHIKDELAEKVPSYVDLRTAHSYGMHCINASFSHQFEVVKPKMRKLICQHAPNKDELEKYTKLPYNDVMKEWTQLANLAKVGLAKDATTIRDIADMQGLEPVMAWTEIDAVILPSIQDSEEDTETIDFTDMLYFPIVHKLWGKRYDYVIVDEFQDYNKLMERLLLRACKKYGTIVAVGDDNQAIYAFSGSVSGMMDRFARKVQATVFELPICYRCPQSHIRLAQELVPDIQPYKPEEGSITAVHVKDFHKNIKPGDLVMCRTTAPLVQACIELIVWTGKKARVLGNSDTEGEQLISFIDQFKVKDKITLIKEINKYQADKVNEYTKAKKFHLIETVENRCDSVRLLLSYCQTVTQARNTIKNIFNTDDAEIVLCTVHRAKGCEADNVWIISGHLLPHPMGMRSKINQEDNIQFIAYTRSKKNLYFVTPQPPTVTSSKKILRDDLNLTRLQAKYCGLLPREPEEKKLAYDGMTLVDDFGLEEEEPEPQSLREKIRAAIAKARRENA